MTGNSSQIECQATAPKWRPLAQDDLDHAFLILSGRWESFRGKRIFLTGGTGFIGKWMLATLLEADRRLALGCRIVVLTRDPNAFRQQAAHLANAPQVQLRSGDIRTPDSGLDTFDMVVHAATDAVVNGRPLDTFDTCVQGTRCALNLAVRTGAKEFLLVSSGAVYGRQPREMPRMDEKYLGLVDNLKPEAAYAEGKRAAEWLACAYAAETSLKVKIARCFAFVGPYLPLNRHFAVGNFLSDILNGRPIIIQGDGTPIRSYLHASDMASWLWDLLLRGKSGETYNIGGEEPVSILQTARLIADAGLINTPIELRRKPTSDSLPDRYLPDLTKIRSHLELPPPLTTRDAVNRTVKWFRESHSGAA